MDLRGEVKENIPSRLRIHQRFCMRGLMQRLVCLLKQWPQGCVVFLLIGLLSGCVTETSGGFNVERSPSKALENYINLAVGYLEQDDLPNAKRHLANATSLDGNNSEVYAIWGLVYSREGEEDLADESFRRALRINPGNSQARNNYSAFLFANNRFSDAYDELQRVVQDTEYPARAQAFENLGLSALRLNRIDDAENAFRRAVQLN
jgi:type IV pilus assembly protein PilF